MKSQILIVSSLICILSIRVGGQQAEPAPQNHAAGDGYEVNVRKVTKLSLPDAKPLFEITYDYEFRDLKSVYVPGIGSAPAKGSFKYKTYEPQLEFRDPSDGHVITGVLPTPTSFALGADSTETPKESDFPQAARTGVWAPIPSFPVVAVALIQRYFPLGYVSQAVGQTNYYITYFRALDQPDPQLRSQIALMVSQPYDIKGNHLEYHVQFIARDYPRLSATKRYGDDRSQNTLDAATRFVNQFVTDLQTAGKHP